MQEKNEKRKSGGENCLISQHVKHPTRVGLRMLYMLCMLHHEGSWPGCRSIFLQVRLGITSLMESLQPCHLSTSSRIGSDNVALGEKHSKVRRFGLKRLSSHGGAKWSKDGRTSARPNEMCLLACAVVGKKESKVLKSCSRRQEGKGLPVGANRSLEASDLLMWGARKCFSPSLPKLEGVF